MNATAAFSAKTGNAEPRFDHPHSPRIEGWSPAAWVGDATGHIEPRCLLVAARAPTISARKCSADSEVKGMPGLWGSGEGSLAYRSKQDVLVTSCTLAASSLPWPESAGST